MSETIQSLSPCTWSIRIPHGARACSRPGTDAPQKLVSKGIFAACCEPVGRSSVRARAFRHMQSKSVNHLVCAFLSRCIRQMQKLGLTQTELAKRMKVSRPYVTRILSGDVNITFGTALRLARLFEMDLMPELRDNESKEIVAVKEDLTLS